MSEEIKEKGYDIDFAYTYFGEDGIVVKEPGQPEKKYDMSAGWNEPLIQVPLGYGVMAVATGTVGDDVESKIGVKPGDFAIRFGKLEKQVQTGTPVTEEMAAYADKHSICELVMTKDYAKRLVDILNEYIEKEGE